MEKFESIEVATNWWIQKIQTPSVYYNGDASAASEIESFITFLVTHYYRKLLNQEQIDIFKEILSNLIQKEIEEKGFCHLDVDDKPYGILEKARSASKINKILFPWKTKMQVYQDKVILMQAEGYGRKIDTIYLKSQNRNKKINKIF